MLVGVGDVETVGVVSVAVLRLWVGHSGQSLGPEGRHWDVAPVNCFSLVPNRRHFWWNEKKTRYEP